jgi:hypothetical protein
MMKPLSFRAWIDKNSPSSYLEYLQECNAQNLYCIAETLDTLLLETKIHTLSRESLSKDELSLRDRNKSSIAENAKHA